MFGVSYSLGAASELANAFGVKVGRSAPAENEEEDNGKDCDVHQEEEHGMKGADDDVEGDPGDEEPACPVATVEHEDARDDLQKTREMDVPVAYQITTTPHSTQ
jgi:hypothetical protein